MPYKTSSLYERSLKGAAELGISLAIKNARNRLPMIREMDKEGKEEFERLIVDHPSALADCFTKALGMFLKRVDIVSTEELKEEMGSGKTLSGLTPASVIIDEMFRADEKEKKHFFISKKQKKKMKQSSVLRAIHNL